PHRVEAVDADGRVRGLAQVLVRSLPAQFKALCHVPRGPVIAPAEPSGTGTWGAGPGVGDDATRDAVTQAVVAWCKSAVGGVGITIEPDWPVGTHLTLPDARPAANPILYPVTLILDLTKSQDELTKAM